MSGFILIGACYGFYIITKSLMACAKAELVKASWEMVYVLFFLISVIAYAYLTATNTIIYVNF